MKTGIRLLSKAGCANGQSDGMNVYIKISNKIAVKTYAANIRDAKLHFKKGISLFY